MEGEVVSEIGQEVIAKIKQRKTNIYRSTKAGYFIVRVDLSNAYAAVGVLDEAKQQVLDMMAFHRIEIAKQQEAKRIKIAGGDSMKREAMKNPSFFKKIMGK